MVLIWTLIGISVLAILGVGTQAVRLLLAQDGKIGWQTTQLANRDEKIDSMQHQIDVQRIQLEQQKGLLAQAQSWIEAERARINALSLSRAASAPPELPEAAHSEHETQTTKP